MHADEQTCRENEYYFADIQRESQEKIETREMTEYPFSYYYQQTENNEYQVQCTQIHVESESECIHFAIKNE